MTVESLYRPAYCNEIINFMAEGFSLTAFAGDIGVSRRTLWNWADTNPEFADAVEKAKAKRVLYWEREHISITRSGEGNITGTIFALKNADPDEWRDRREPVAVILPGSVSDLEVAQRVADLLMSGAEQQRAKLTVIEGDKV